MISFLDWLDRNNKNLKIPIKKDPERQKEHSCEECGSDAVTSFYDNGKKNTECSNISCKTNTDKK